MAAETIREFLVSLGFKLDNAGLKKFTVGIDTATKAVVRLAASIEATAVGIAAGVARMSSNLEALYYASQRTGSSVTNLKAFDQAAQNFGASAGEALASVEGLAHVLRTNPGTEGLLAGLGVQLKHAKDGTVDAQDAMLQLGRVFRNQPMYLAEQYAGMFGMSEKTLIALRNGDFEAEFARMQRTLKAAGFDKAADDAHRFMVGLRDLELQLQKLGVQIVDALQDKFHTNLQKISAWFDKNGPGIASTVATIALAVVGAAGTMIDEFIKLNTATDGWLGKLLAVAAILKVTGAGSLVGGILSMVAGLGKLNVYFLALGAAATAAISLWNLLHDKDASNPISNLVNKGIQAATGDKNATVGGLFHDWNKNANMQQAIQYFRGHGWSPQATAGIVANLQAESSFDPTATNKQSGAYGLAQWLGPRVGEFKKYEGVDLKKSTIEQQLEFINHELRSHPEYGGRLLAASQSAEAAASIVRNWYERPGDDAANEQTRRLVAGAVLKGMTVNTTINVSGAGDPAAVAARVKAAQQADYAQAVRNFVMTAN